MNKLLLAIALFACNAYSTTIELTPNNVVSINDAITGDSISKAQREFHKLVHKRGSQNYPIYVVFDSPGGSVLAGSRFYETVKSHNNVHSIVLRGYSMAAMLPQMMPGRRYIIETGQLLFHRMTVGMEGRLTTEDLEGELEFLKELENSIEQKVVKRSGVSPEVYQRKTMADWTMLAETALRLNFVDEIVTVTCSKELINAKKSILVSILPILPPIQQTVSGCPLDI